MTTRNQAYAKLFELAEFLQVGGAVIDNRSRKFQHFDKVPQEAQPALFQTEPSEAITQRTGGVSIRRWHAVWTIYFRSDPGDATDIPTERLNQFLDSLEELFPSGDPDDRQTLGGLVAHCFIDGEVFKIPGDDDGQGMLVVPITILVP